jgi:GDPmannose 4,6-dehydratase
MSSKKLALITGISGMDGSYLSELLLDKDYIVYGMIRRHSTTKYERLEHIKDKLHLMYGDMSNSSCMQYILSTMIREQGDDFKEFLVINLAANSFVKESFDNAEFVGDIDALGPLRLLEVIRNSGFKDRIKFYQASTSELFGKTKVRPQNEETEMYPASPYGVAKYYSYWIVKNYRESHGMFCVNGILFNHSSPRRDIVFVEKKITSSVAAIQCGKLDCLYLGNLNSKRDIGHSKDFVYGMWLMLQQEKPVDYVLSTGSTYSVREYVDMAFKFFEKKVEWQGEGVEETGSVDGKIVVRVSKEFFRPSEVEHLEGDSSKARRELGWVNKYSTEEIIREMVSHDLSLITGVI